MSATATLTTYLTPILLPAPVPAAVFLATAGTGIAIVTDAATAAATEAAFHHAAAGTWAVYTLGGAALAAGATYCLKAEMDKGRILVGRSLGAFIVGVFGSRLASYHHPKIMEWSADPILLVMIGIAFGLFGYAVAHPVINLIDKLSPMLVRRFFKRSGLLDDLEPVRLPVPLPATPGPASPVLPIVSTSTPRPPSNADDRPDPLT